MSDAELLDFDDGAADIRDCDIKKRLLFSDENDTWLLTRDGKHDLFVEYVRRADNGDDEMRVMSLVEFLQAWPGGPAAQELVRLVGLLVDDAEATSETS